MAGTSKVFSAQPAQRTQPADNALTLMIVRVRPSPQEQQNPHPIPCAASTQTLALAAEPSPPAGGAPPPCSVKLAKTRTAMNVPLRLHVLPKSKKSKQQLLHSATLRPPRRPPTQRLLLLSWQSVKQLRRRVGVPRCGQNADGVQQRRSAKLAKTLTVKSVRVKTSVTPPIAPRSPNRVTAPN